MKQFYTIKIWTFFLMMSCFMIMSAQKSTIPYKELSTAIDSGPFRAGHIQGIAVDLNKKHIYYSYTTMLVKTDLQGKVIGTVTGLLGHLGDLDFYEKDGRVYGSLEYKNDAIGKGILKMEKSDRQLQNAFYIAIFDVDRINRMGMDAEKDGIMTTVYLPTVLNDYLGEVEVNGKIHKHRLGCSGIDGVSFGPKFGKKGGKQYLTVAYGIYGDKERVDNDYQVLLQYDVEKWYFYEQPLSDDQMHTNGPLHPDEQYFAYTGNTTYGIQNLEYDHDLNVWWLAVYKGSKPNFTNYSLYALDGCTKPTKQVLKGVTYLNKGKVVPLWKNHILPVSSTPDGWMFEVGSTGFCALGGGLYYISHPYKQGKEECSTLCLYQYSSNEKPFELIIK